LFQRHDDAFMSRTRKTSPRVEYRERQSQRVKDSVGLAEKFPRLKSLTVNLAYFHANRATGSNQMKYKVNIQHAKSVFWFPCQAGECVGGDFDLSEALTQAVAGRRKVVTGEMRCLGHRNRGDHHAVPCQALLRYTLNLGYV